MPRSVAVDIETTGLDLNHGSLPYLITTCDEDGQQVYWECPVDPLTRECRFPPSDRCSIKEHLLEFDNWYFLNPVFDMTGLFVAGMKWVFREWHRVRDIGIAAHLVDSANNGSNKTGDLTTLSLKYLGIDVAPYEKKIRKVVLDARRCASKDFPNWRTGKDGDPKLPSGGGWKCDMWLPTLLADELGYEEDHPWRTTGTNYALSDTACTLPLGQLLEEMIRDKGLWKLYEERTKLLKISQLMEYRGISLSEERTHELKTKYDKESKTLGKQCVAIARSVGSDLQLPKSGSNKSLIKTVYDKQHLAIKPVEFGKSGDPLLNANVIKEIMNDFPGNSKPYRFLDCLLKKRKRDTASGTYITNYMRYWLPHYYGDKGWRILHPSVNPVGSNTLRWTSSHPNEQNVSKKKGFNLRYCFGPAPGREWWSMDFINLELRLPAWESGEEELINLFENSDEPPYYGSEHLLNFSTVYPDIWEKELKKVGLDKVGPHIKDKYEDTWYQWVKNGDFAVGYGAVEVEGRMGTADKAFHREGSHAKLKERFAKKERLNQYWIEFAEEFGYVETMPDKFVDPDHGYPIVCPRSERGTIKPTIPLNYHIQGTAMWLTMMGMIRVYEYLDQLHQREYGVTTEELFINSKYFTDPSIGYFLIMQVHDEIVLDFPAGTGPEPYKTNLPIIRDIKGLLESGGEGIGVPTPVSCEYHPVSWDKGVSIDVAV